MNTALLIIDVQHGFVAEDPQPYEADLVIERINHLAQRSRAVGVPVVFIQHERPATHVNHGSVGWQFDSRLQLEASDHIVAKTTPDSFLRTNLQELLMAHNVSHVVITGYASEFCVDTTVRRAAALGFVVTLAADAHTTHDKAHASALLIRAHENATLPDIVSFGVKISAVPSSEIIFGTASNA